MKSLGKKTICATHFMDGVQKSAREITLTVYQKGDQYFVNHGGTKASKPVTANPDGTFSAAYHVTTVRSHSFEDIKPLLMGQVKVLP